MTKKEIPINITTTSRKRKINEIIVGNRRKPHKREPHCYNVSCNTVFTVNVDTFSYTCPIYKTESVCYILRDFIILWTIIWIKTNHTTHPYAINILRIPSLCVQLRNVSVFTQSAMNKLQCFWHFTALAKYMFYKRIETVIYVFSFILSAETKYIPSYTKKPDRSSSGRKHDCWARGPGFDS